MFSLFQWRENAQQHLIQAMAGEGNLLVYLDCEIKTLKLPEPPYHDHQQREKKIFYIHVLKYLKQGDQVDMADKKNFFILKKADRN